MGCVKLHILDEQYKQTELRISYSKKKLTPIFFVENARKEMLLKFIDPDGKAIEYANNFHNSDFGRTYSYLMKNNSAFNLVLRAYKYTDKFNLTINITDTQPDKDAAALTESRKQPGFPWEPPIVSAEVTMIFPDSKSRTWRKEENLQYTELGMVMVIAHETIHTYTSFADKRKEDTNHEVFNVYFRALTDILGEYNRDKSLGLSETQIFELALSGQQNSVKFKNYINSIVETEKNKGTYETEEFKKQGKTPYEYEKSKFSDRIYNLIYENKPNEEK